ncbi:MULTISPECIES: hypothetical protein [unclassified Pseudodesulfovibrio]|uniref:hypothetical protein n=1 Tax=unclassified Pseudodesulfovibrio TaxID=2661612 RepID=UPI000FEBA294|nr:MULTISPECIES: hypothetical protein [unclassified Pseudodesulfovibrio]MCJ2165542.1 hypothetical protein [Pseudodesulfovibrio sp. S3-i]RWU03097.1 hypothetical protein DWB63_12895 [Pseudodesulfovibrio sp. S3]
MARYQVDNCVADIMKRAGVDDNTAMEIMQSAMNESERIKAELGVDMADVRLDMIAQGFGEAAHEAAIKDKKRLLKNINFHQPV